MSADDLEIAGQFLATLAMVAKTGERKLLYPFLASDVEWVMPQCALIGIDEVREQLIWITEPESFDLEFEATGLRDLGDGRIVSGEHETSLLKTTGEPAHARDHRIELTIRGGKIGRYERTS